MTSSISALIYLLAGSAIVYLFLVRRRHLGVLKSEHLPGMDQEGFKQLIILLKTAYERTLYLGVAFFPLAYATYQDNTPVSRLVFAVLILLLFIANIPPRHKIVRLLEQYGFTIDDLRKQGVRV